MTTTPYALRCEYAGCSGQARWMVTKRRVAQQGGSTFGICSKHEPRWLRGKAVSADSGTAFGTTPIYTATEIK